MFNLVAKSESIEKTVENKENLFAHRFLAQGQPQIAQLGQGLEFLLAVEAPVAPMSTIRHQTHRTNEKNKSKTIERRSKRAKVKNEEQKLKTEIAQNVEDKTKINKLKTLPSTGINISIGKTEELSSFVHAPTFYPTGFGLYPVQLAANPNLALMNYQLPNDSEILRPNDCRKDLLKGQDPQYGLTNTVSQMQIFTGGEVQHPSSSPTLLSDSDQQLLMRLPMVRKSVSGSETEPESHSKHIKSDTNTKPKKRRNRICEVEGCEKNARGRTPYCVKHGGGARCEIEGCEKGARPHSQYCSGHGGGHRCLFTGCNKGALAKSVYCRRHGKFRQSVPWQ